MRLVALLAVLGLPCVFGQWEFANDNVDQFEPWGSVPPGDVRSGPVRCARAPQTHSAARALTRPMAGAEGPNIDHVCPGIHAMRGALLLPDRGASCAGPVPALPCALLPLECGLLPGQRGGLFARNPAHGVLEHPSAVLGWLLPLRQHLLQVNSGRVRPPQSAALHRRPRRCAWRGHWRGGRRSARAIPHEPV